MSLLKVVRITRFQCRHFTNRNIMVLRKRNLINDVFPANSDTAITDLVNASPQCVYAGFDPTADSLHIGNLLILMKLLHWQRAGHQVVALLGGATGSIGDPSGRNTERVALKKDILQRNLLGIGEDIRKVFTNHERHFWKTSEQLKPVEILNNEDWYKKMNAIDFVGELGRNFRMGTMLLKQSVKARIDSESGMSFTEFAYQIFQAYDWLYLLRKYNCRFQIGGSDQMGNILAGHDLINRFTDDQVYGITLPIITTEEGNKFGKSAGNAIWLNPAKTTPYSFYQFFVRTKDSDVEKFLQYFTFLPLKDIENIMERHRAEPEKFLAQRILAESLTKLVHGESGLEKAQTATKVLFSKNVEDLLRLSEKEMSEVFDSAPTVYLMPQPGMNILALAMQAKCFGTQNDAMRIIKAGGFSCNYQKCTNIEEIVTESTHIMPNKTSLLRVGKKNYYLVKWMR